MTFEHYIRNPNTSPAQNPRKHKDATENKPGDRNDFGLKTGGKKEKKVKESEGLGLIERRSSFGF